jgi:predicted RNase H-like HicB family nuclease
MQYMVVIEEGETAETKEKVLELIREAIEFHIEALTER